MAIAKPVYASPTTLTITQNGLSNNTYQQSDVFDNSTTRYEDGALGGSIQVGTTPVDKSTIEIFLYGTFDGTNYTSGCSGSNGAYTANGEEGLLPRAAIIYVDTTSDQDYVWGPVSVRAAFGGVMPQKFGAVVLNKSGATTHATGTNNIMKFTGLNTEI